MHHPNRFVREAAHNASCAVSVALGATSSSTTGSTISSTAGSTGSTAPGAGSSTVGTEGAAPPTLQEFGRELAPLLADGLTDNWSQVRYINNLVSTISIC